MFEKQITFTLNGKKQIWRGLVKTLKYVHPKMKIKKVQQYSEIKNI